MQGIPTGDLGPAVDLYMIFAVTIILVLLVSILGYRRRTRHVQYWIIAIIGFVLLWWFLSEMVSSMILIYTGYPLEMTLIIINIAIVLIFLGFCFLVIVIERYSGLSKIESKTTEVINTR